MMERPTREGLHPRYGAHGGITTSETSPPWQGTFPFRRQGPIPRSFEQYRTLMIWLAPQRGRPGFGCCGDWRFQGAFEEMPRIRALT